jgi:hypothetical protein
MNTLRENPLDGTREIRKKKVLGEELNVGIPLFKGTWMWNEVKERALMKRGVEQRWRGLHWCVCVYVFGKVDSHQACDACLALPQNSAITGRNLSVSAHCFVQLHV